MAKSIPVRFSMTLRTPWPKARQAEGALERGVVHRLHGNHALEVVVARQSLLHPKGPCRCSLPHADAEEADGCIGVVFVPGDELNRGDDVFALLGAPGHPGNGAPVALAMVAEVVHQDGVAGLVEVLRLSENQWHRGTGS